MEDNKDNTTIEDGAIEVFEAKAERWSWQTTLVLGGTVAVLLFAVLGFFAL
jgi:hypothetical protein